MFLVDMTFTDITKVTPELTLQHRDYLAAEYANGNLIFGGRKEPRTGGILLSKHNSEQALRDVLNDDPFVKNGVVECVITTFEPVMAAEQYQHLLP